MFKFKIAYGTMEDLNNCPITNGTLYVVDEKALFIDTVDGKRIQISTIYDEQTPFLYRDNGGHIQTFSPSAIFSSTQKVLEIQPLDLNAILDSGYYFIKKTTETIPNAPFSGENIFLQVFANEKDIFQLCYSLDVNKMFLRRREIDGSWTTWKETSLTQVNFNDIVLEDNEKSGVIIAKDQKLTIENNEVFFNNLLFDNYDAFSSYIRKSTALQEINAVGDIKISALNPEIMDSRGWLDLSTKKGDNNSQVEINTTEGAGKYTKLINLMAGGQTFKTFNADSKCMFLLNEKYVVKGIYTTQSSSITRVLTFDIYKNESIPSSISSNTEISSPYEYAFSSIYYIGQKKQGDDLIFYIFTPYGRSGAVYEFVIIEYVFNMTNQTLNCSIVERFLDTRAGRESTSDKLNDFTIKEFEKNTTIYFWTSVYKDRRAYCLFFNKETKKLDYYLLSSCSENVDGPVHASANYWLLGENKGLFLYSVQSNSYSSPHFFVVQNNEKTRYNYDWTTKEVLLENLRGSSSKNINYPMWKESYDSNYYIKTSDFQDKEYYNFSAIINYYKGSNLVKVQNNKNAAAIDKLYSNRQNIYDFNFLNENSFYIIGLDNYCYLYYYDGATWSLTQSFNLFYPTIGLQANNANHNIMMSNTSAAILSTLNNNNILQTYGNKSATTLNFPLIAPLRNVNNEIFARYYIKYE